MAALWGGRIVSESALTTRINAARSAVGDSGEAQRLIKTLPRKGLRFVGVVREGKNFGAVQPSMTFESQALLSLPEGPSIAVLPFANMSGDPEQEYFADGMVEEIITALSRFRNLFVIARNSSFTYKGRAVDVKQVGRELGVRYVLEGGIRKSANRVRITAQLVDVSTGAHLWADRFERALEDIFDLQDQVTENVVGAIAPKLEQAEIARAKRKPIQNLDAHDYYLRGMANFHRRTKEAAQEALQQFYKAIELDPEFSSAYGMAAYCYVWRKSGRWMVNGTAEQSEAARLARKAMDLGRQDAIELTTAGFKVSFVVGDLNDGASLTARALELNPNFALAWSVSGRAQVWLGEPELAIEHLEHCMQLSPFDPLASTAQNGIAWAHFFAGRYDEASSWAKKALQESPKYHSAMRILVASSALAGRLEDARKTMDRLREIDPTLCVSDLRDFPPLRRPEDFARYSEGMRKAGLPE